LAFKGDLTPEAPTKLPSLIPGKVVVGESFMSMGTNAIDPTKSYFYELKGESRLY
jgi:hypothetical protein